MNKLEAADVVNEKTSKYLLTTNTQDQQDEVTTKLYKGDVIPTMGGGRQVVFTDVEVLTQESPEKQDRKRSFEEFRGIEVCTQFCLVYVVLICHIHGGGLVLNCSVEREGLN